MIPEALYSLLGAVRALMATVVAMAFAGSFALPCDLDADEEADEIPAWTQWSDRELSADFDGDGLVDDAVRLSQGILSPVLIDGDVALEPDEGWLVFDAIAADLDDDGCDELLLLVWKRGSYGDHAPFWETDDDTWSQHVFVFGMSDGRFKPLWMSSKVGVQIAWAELDQDELLVLHSPDGSWTKWEWQSWGFVLVDDSAGILEPGESEEYVYTYTHISDDVEKSQSATMVFAGDNIAHSNIYEACYVSENGGFDFSSVYGQVSDYLSGFDFAGVCQETVLVPDPALVSGYPEFGTPREMGEALSAAGFDGVFCATNHVMDKGSQGVRSTLEYWESEQSQMMVAGIHDEAEDAGEARHRNVAGFEVAFFNATYGLNGHNPQTGEEYLVDTFDDWPALLEQITQVEGQVDLAVVYLHAGEEYSAEPTDEQERLVAEAIDAGADLVLCSHTHVVGTYGVVETPAGNTGLVYWGLGNFVASQGRPECQLGGLATVTLGRDVHGGAVIAGYDLVPTICHVMQDGGVTVYLLDDYTDELASQMALKTEGPNPDVEGYWELFEQAVGIG